MKEILKEATIASAFLMLPAVLAFVVCFVRGVRAELREFKERKK